MLKELQKEMIIEIKDQLVSLKETQIKLNSELKENEEEITKYRSIISDVTQDEKIIEYKKNYSKISKFFNKRKYNKGLIKLHFEIEDNCKLKLHELLEKNKLIKMQIEKNDESIDGAIDSLKLVEAAKNIESLPINYERAKELLSKKGKNILDYEIQDILKLGPSIETTGNVVFMKRAISEYPFFIIYDQTKDFDMYYDFISKLEYINGTGKYTSNMFDEFKKSVLDYLTKSKNGEIRIKSVYIIEAIRFYFKDIITNGYGEQLEKDNIIDTVHDALWEINVICDCAQKLSDEDYYRLEKMYNPQENNYYCHETSGEITKERMQAILSNGLAVSHEWVRTCSIGANCRKLDCFLAIAGYRNFYGGHRSEGDKYRIIYEIPKDTLRPIGSDKVDGKETYILPDYLIAYMHDKKGDDGEISVSSLHINSNKRKTYRYLYEDNYDPQRPFAYENSDVLSEGKGK